MGRKPQPYKDTKEYRERKRFFCSKCGKEITPDKKKFRNIKDNVYMHETCYFNE